MVRIRFPPAVSRQTIGSSAVIGVPDGDNPVQPIRPPRIGGKGRLIAEYADLIGAENLFAEYQCGLAAARGPPRSSPRRRPRRNPATSAGSRHRRKAAPIQQRQPAAGGFNWDRSWRIASTRTLEASPRRSGKAGAPLEERPRGWYRSSAAQFKAHGGRGCCSCGEASVSTRWVAITGGKAAPSFSQPMEVWSRPGGGAPLRV